MGFSVSGAVSGGLSGYAYGWPGAIAGGVAGGFLGGAETSASSARDVNSQQIDLAREQMAFQERMSSTAHQREVADLRAAGLNPILSATGGSGASSPGGAMPVLQNPDKQLAQDRALIGNLVANTAKALSEVKTQKTQQVLNLANATAASGSVGIPGFLKVPFQTAANLVQSGLNSAKSFGKQPVVPWLKKKGIV